MKPTTSDLIPLIVITGFLGSGKTTLLRKLLTTDLGGETAVLINELGEIGIDHLLVGEMTYYFGDYRSGRSSPYFRDGARRPDATASLQPRRDYRGGGFIQCKSA